MRKGIISVIVVITIGMISFNAAALQKLTVILDWFPNPDHAPLFVAQQQGYFAKQGLEVEFIGPASPSDPPKLVAAGKADIAITYQPQLLLDVQQGLPIVRFGTLINSPLGCIIANGKEIESLKDLQDKTVGYSAAGVDSVMLNAMLHSAKLSINDVSLINVNYALVQALLTHRVDAVTGVQRNFELVELQQQKFPVEVFYPERYDVPSYDELIFITHKNNISDPRLLKFLIAEQQGEDYLEQNPEQTWKVFANNHPELNNALNREAWFATLPFFAKDPIDLDQPRYNKFMQFMVNQGLLSKPVPLSDYAVEINRSNTSH
jgi:putative hydroxymethylpyrimidine transport system substrate-binding protein